MSGSRRETPKFDRSRKRPRPQEWVAKPKVGDTLGSFRLLQLLGEGGAGVVYRAEHSFLKRPVAIKILHPELYLRPAMVARFFQEALAVNRARHRNIIDITDVVATEGFPPFIVMELLSGEDLGDWIDRHAPLDLAFTVDVARQICDALDVVHRLEIVHRDLKPENIFLAREDGEDAHPVVKLLDFGIAKFIDAEENRRRTWSGNILGTPAYMPLEQLHGLPVDHRADIYALGVVLYEMLTRHLPFEIEGMDDLADGALSKQPPPPSARVGAHAAQPIPPEVDAVVMRCLAGSPNRRFQSVKELSEALQEAARQGGIEVGDRAPAGRGGRWGRGSGKERPPWPATSPVETSEPASSVVEALRRRTATTPPDSGSGSDGDRDRDGDRDGDGDGDGDTALPRIPTPPGREPHAKTDGAIERAGAAKPIGEAHPASAARPDLTLEVERRRSLLTLSSLVAALLALVAVGLLVVLSITQGWWKTTASGSGADRTLLTGPGSQADRPTRPGIALESEPSQARIHQADTDALLGQTPTRLPVTEGRPQVLVLRKAGYQDARVTLRHDGPDPVRIWLEPVRPSSTDPPRDPPMANDMMAPGRPGEPLPGMRPVQAPQDPQRHPPGTMTEPMVTEQGIVDPFPM